MADNVLAELLISILTQVDSSSAGQAMDAVTKQQRKVTEAEKKGQDTRHKNLAASLAAGLKQVEGYTKSIVGFGEKVALGFAGVATSIEGAAISGTFALARLSNQMAAAYYASQKIGSSVKDMEAFKFASEEVGSSAAKAQAGLEELGRLKNTNPAAYVGLLQRLGVAATDASGKLRAPAQAAADLAAALSKMPRQQALLFGNQLGMDDDQTLAMMRPEFQAKLAQYEAMRKKIGFDPDQAAADGAKFQQIWTKMWTAVDIVSKKVEAAFFNQVGGSVDHITDWIIKNAGRISDAAVKIGNFVIHLATSIVDLVANFDKLDPSTQRFVEILALVAGGLLALTSGPIGAIMALAAALAFLWDDYEKYKQGLPHIVDWDKWEPKIKAAIQGLTDFWTKFDELSAKLTGQGGLQTAMEAFATYMAVAWVGKLLGAFTKVEVGWLGLVARLMANPYFAAIAALIGGAAISADSAKNIQSADPAANDLYVDPETGVATKTAPGTGNQFTGGLGDTNNSILGRAWNWTKSKLGFGDNDKPGVPYEAKSATDAMGVTQKEWDAFREGVTDIEGKNYGKMGGAGRRYAGRYQMGPTEIDETAKRLAVARPTNEQFLADPQMQERFFENYTVDHYNTLMKNPKFAAMSHREQLKILGYAHNQGTGGPSRENGAWGYIDRGAVGRDAFGTAGTDYFAPIDRRLAESDKAAAPGLPSIVSPAEAAEAPIGDAAALAAEQRRAAGKALAGDETLISRYHRQQATPAVPRPVGELGRLDRARATDAPVRVELTDTSTQKIRHYGHEQFDRRIYGAVAARSSANMDRMFNPSPLMPAGIGPSSFNAITNHNTPTVHQQIAINGVQDPYSISDHLKVHATRGVQDGIRTIQGPSG